MENSKEKQIEEMRYLADEMGKAISTELEKRYLADERKLEEVLKANGWCKASDLAEEIFAEIEKLLRENQFTLIPPYRSEITDWKTVFRLKLAGDIAELKKKYTEEGK